MTPMITHRNPMTAVFHGVAMFYVVGIAIGLSLATLGALIGLLPWIALPLETAGGVFNAGPIAQSGVTLFSVSLLAFLPASLRVMTLENSHRNFAICMEDVFKAYMVAHEADRAGVFNMKSEFDAVRERLEFMRNHPDLYRLEPGVLEVAAQMGQISHDLAEVYSDENVERAQSVLRQRQQEMQDFTDQLELARTRTDDIKRWSTQLEAENAVAGTQLEQLKDDLRELLPPLGLKAIKAPQKKTKVAEDKPANNVVEITKGKAQQTTAAQ